MCDEYCVCVCERERERRDECSGWMLAQQWKPQDGGDLMLGLNFSVFPRKRKSASHNVRFVVSCAVMLLFSLFLSPLQFCTASGKMVKKGEAVLRFSRKMDEELRSSS